MSFFQVKMALIYISPIILAYLPTLISQEPTTVNVGENLTVPIDPTDYYIMGKSSF